jgi:hypothetical protein
MALTVENGSNVAGADSYVSLVDFKAYADARGLAYPIDDTLIEQAIRRATGYIETYRGRFPGYRTYRRAQLLEWPRTGAYYYVPDAGRSQAFYFFGQQDYGFGVQGFDTIGSNTIPPEIIKALCEAASREVNDPGTMEPDFERGGAIQSLTAGSVGIVYSGAAIPGTSRQIIDGILAGLLMPSGGMFGTAERM